MKNINPLNCCDFYKTGHRQQYPKGTELVVSNLTPRSGKHANVGDKSGIVFFGLQYFIKEFLQDTWNDNFFDQKKSKVVADYKRRMDTSLGKDSIPVDHIEALHDLGYLPIEIKALPEGTIVPVGCPCLTIHNTHPEFFWLTNYLESVLSAYLWMPCTSATTAYNYRKLIDKYIKLTGSPEWFADFQAHDFSFRGQSSLQSAMLSGAAHLCFFKGTDTVAAIDLLEQYYDADADVNPIGMSVPATEHSVMCMGGMDTELDTFKRLITEIYPNGIVSIVSDTWDFWQVLTEYAPKLKDTIIARNGKVVFRPDSGDPYKILVGDDSLNGESNPTVDAVRKGAVEVLWDTFGGTITETGHKLLDSHVGLIYGDSITYELAEKILDGLHKKGFASANVVFGVGSFTYQYVTRDTWGWAVKATYGVVNGVPQNIFKAPKTDDGTKNSAKGLLCVYKTLDGKLTFNQEVSEETFRSEDNLLKIVFFNGCLTSETSLEEIRNKNKG